jgi:glycosyltransferase involved in cell wall biosynthesis
MNKQTPIVSVIIPIYNDELYLRDALRSIQQQTFADFECICINDGSVDKSEVIIDEFTRSDSRFVKINRANGGVSAARNTGLKAAKGAYVFFMDHDDLIPAYTLKKLYEASAKYNADMSRGRMMMIAEDFKLEQLPKEEGKSKQYFYTNPLTDYYRHIRGKNKKWYFIWMCLFKKSTLTDVKFVEELRSGGEDFLFTFDAVSKIKNFVQISDVVTCHRYSKISVTLNGYKPQLFFEISKIVIPYIYHKYKLDSNIDKRLLRWVYCKESYAAYRFLIRNLIKKNYIDSLSEATNILLNMIDTPAFNEVLKYWNFRQKIFFRLVINEKYDIARKFKIFM